MAELGDVFVRDTEMMLGVGNWAEWNRLAWLVGGVSFIMGLFCSLMVLVDEELCSVSEVNEFVLKNPLDLGSWLELGDELVLFVAWGENEYTVVISSAVFTSHSLISPLSSFNAQLHSFLSSCINDVIPPLCATLILFFTT